MQSWDMLVMPPRSLTNRTPPCLPYSRVWVWPSAQLIEVICALDPPEPVPNVPNSIRASLAISSQGTRSTRPLLLIASPYGSWIGDARQAARFQT